MKIAKILPLFFVFGLMFAWQSAQAQEGLSEQLQIEFSVDDIDAQSLGVQAPAKVEGQGGYWWENVKRNLDLFFTFDQEKKTNKEQSYASKMLLEAKIIAEQNPNNTEALDKALERYRQFKEKLAERIKNNAELRQQMQNNLDNTEFRQQQLMLEIGQKLPDEARAKLEQIKATSLREWYEANKDNIRERLEKVVDQNNNGTDFRQIKNIAVLQEIADKLPEEAQDKIEAVSSRATQRLEEKLQDISTRDTEKVTPYINNLQIHEQNMQRLMLNLESANLPTAVKNNIQDVKTQNLERLKEQWASMTEQQKIQYLQNFDTRAHPVYVDMLDQLDNTQDDLSTEVRDLIKKIKQQQIEGVKTKLEATTDVQKLRAFENNVNNTELRNAIRTRRMEVGTTPASTPQLQFRQNNQ